MKNMIYISMIVSAGILVSGGARAEAVRCEKVGSYAPSGDDTFAVKCNGEIVKGAEILPEAAADKVIQEKEQGE